MPLAAVARPKENNRDVRHREGSRERARAVLAALVAGPLLPLAMVFLVAELILALRSGLPLGPFIGCALVFTIAIFWVASLPPTPSAAVAARILLVAILFKTFAVGVALTGGLQSPYQGLLYLPVFLSALYFGLVGGASTGIALTVFYITIVTSAARASGQVMNVPTLLTSCGVALLVSVGAGAFSEHLRFTAVQAGRRARQNASRATQAEWFTDTGKMLQAMDDLEPVLSAALLRLDELVTCDAAAIFLRDPDDSDMLLTQTMGLNEAQIGLRRIPLERQEWLHTEDFQGIYVSSVLPGDPDLGVFAELNPAARSVIVVPLQTFAEVSGVLYVASNKPGGLSEQDRDQLSEFAHHIVFPVQRVRLQAMATTDALTGLNNNRAFRKRLHNEVERSQRYRHPLSFLLLDIDHFKNVNDTLGHPAGDAILSQCGGILRRMTRGIDYPVRYGGEELAVLCPETTLEAASLLAERIRSAIAATDFHTGTGEVVHITVSVGVAELTVGTGTETSLVAGADAALYAAKSSGRNRVCLQERETRREEAQGANEGAARR